MRITAGNPLERGKDLSLTNANEYVSKLGQEKFNGYICVTIKGKRGIEEGVLLFHDGRIIASSYDYFYYKRTYQGETALERTANALASKLGIIDVFSLSSYQVQLVMTLNEEASLKKPLEPQNLKIPDAYSTKYEDTLSVSVQQGQEQKTNLAKKLGLTSDFLKGMTREDILQLAKEEDEKVEKMVK